MKEDIKIPWIRAGYEFFAYEGPIGLKVERLAIKVGKNKSSFYHLFADVEVFTEILLKHHIEQAHIMAAKESNCSTKAELIDVLIQHKIDLFFNRQLRVHRENPDFHQCFVNTNEIALPAIREIWGEIIDLQENSYLAALVFRLSIENFYLQITDETMEETWLNNYFEELRQLVQAFRKNEALKSLKR